jgi:ABC-type branched-subunit amino acid transport system substrate-binding protein
MCSNAPVTGTPGVTDSTITIGNVSTLTGPVPGLFAGAKNGLEAFAAYINNTGGICGRQLKVDAGDDNLDPSQNATATQSLAGSVLAFVGSFSIDDAGGASVLASNNVPDVGQALAPQRADLTNNFSPQPNPLGWNVSPYLYFEQRFGPDVVTHMAFFSAAAAGRIASVQEQAMEAVGYKFVYSETSIQATQTDYSAEVNTMKSRGVKGIVFQAPATIAGDMAKDMANAGFSVPFANWGSPAYDPQFVSSGGPATNGAVLNIPTAMFQGEDAGSVPEVGLFDKYYEALYGTPPDLFAAYAWTSGMLFVDGLNAGGAPTRPALLTGLKSITSFNAGGILAASNPAGKKPPLCYLVVDIVNGRFVRDRADPPTGFRCDANGAYWYAHG